MSTETRPRRARPDWLADPILPIGDAAVFAVFTTIGLLSHHDSFTDYHFLRNFIPLTLSWFLIAVILDTYGKGGVVRVAATWLLAVVAGVAVRVWWVGNPNGRELWTFLGVALAANGVFLLTWRLAIGWVRGHGPGSVARRAREVERIEPEGRG